MMINDGEDDRQSDRSDFDVIETVSEGIVFEQQEQKEKKKEEDFCQTIVHCQILIRFALSF